jgi:hypothetical protein
MKRLALRNCAADNQRERASLALNWLVRPGLPRRWSVEVAHQLEVLSCQGLCWGDACTHTLRNACGLGGRDRLVFKRGVNEMDGYHSL